MISDNERREVARRLREVEGYAIPDRRFADHPITGEVIAAAVMYDLPDVKGLLGRLADLIEPSCDLGSSGWTSFDERPPEPGAPVLCKGKNGAYYVGKPVTYDGERTGEVWVPRGAEYRSPAAWRPVDSPPCDRDAPLKLAEELDGLGLSGFSSGWSSGAVNVGYFARRIRASLGVSDDA